MEEISLKGKFSLELIKKERFAGSFCGMRYMLMMEDGKLLVKGTYEQGSIER